MVRLVECDGSIELDEMKQHLYYGFGSGGALFFATYSGAKENSLTDHFLFVGVQHSVPKYVVIGMETLVLSSRRHAWFAHVLPNRRVSFRVRRYPSCILLTCVLVRSCAFFELMWGRGHSWHRAEEFLLKENMADERESQQRVHSQNTNSHMTLGVKQAQHHTPIRCVA